MQQRNNHRFVSVRDLWFQWTQPHHTIIKQTDRVRAQALTSILLAMFLIGMIYEVLVILTNETTAEFLAIELPIVFSIGF